MPRVSQENRADPRLPLSALSINLYCAAGKPSLNPAVKHKSLFSLNIEHFHSLYLFSWITRQTFPAYEFPRRKSACVWILTPAPRPRPSGGAGARAAGISARPGGERRGTRRDFGQPRTELDPAIHPSWGRGSQTSGFWGLSRISLRARALLRGKLVAERVCHDRTSNVGFGTDRRSLVRSERTRERQKLRRGKRKRESL